MNANQTCPGCGNELPAGTECPHCPAVTSAPVVVARTIDGAKPAAGTAADELPSVEELNEKLPQLEVVELLGYGGMGAVYKALQKSLDRFVALKIIKASLGEIPSFAARFSREARALAKLSHPNIVGVHDFGKVDDVFYLIMEYVEGTDLRQLISTKELEAEQALSIVPQICSALQFAHDQEIVHRDIKPENILVDRGGNVKVADFGLAKLLTETEQDLNLTSTNQVMGTVKYMAPEQLEGSPQIDHRADIYSLGVVFYELLTGELPLGRFAVPSEKAQIDARIDDIVLRALEKNTSDRYQQASDIQVDVQHLSHGTSQATMPPPPKPVAKDVPQKNGFGGHVDVVAYFSLAVGGIIAVGGLGAFLFLLTIAGSTSGMGARVMGFVAFATLIFCALLGVVALTGSVAMLKRESRGRGVGIGLALFMLFAFPIGTVLGVYMLWVLSNEKCVAPFAKSS